MQQLLNPTPDIPANHPVVEREARRLGWLQRAGTPQRYSQWIFLLVIAVVVALYIAWMLFQWLDVRYRVPDYWFIQASTGFWAMLSAVSLLSSIPLDYVSINAALNSISSEMVFGTWDLLRLTSVREGELVLAKHAGAQLRSWRATMLVVGLRIASGVFAVFLTATTYFTASNIERNDLLGISLIPFLLFNIIPFAALFGVFILEPLWRMRAVTSIGMAISARSPDGATSGLLAIGVLLAFWFVQVIVVIAIAAGMSVLIYMLAAFGGAVFAPLILLGVLFATVYGFYSVLKTWGLRQVARRIATFSR